MTFSTNEKGESKFELSKAETKLFFKRKPVIKFTGCSDGDYLITIKLTKEQRR